MIPELSVFTKEGLMKWKSKTHPRIIIEIDTIIIESFEVDTEDVTPIQTTKLQSNRN